MEYIIMAERLVNHRVMEHFHEEIREGGLLMAISGERGKMEIINPKLSRLVSYNADEGDNIVTPFTREIYLTGALSAHRLLRLTAEYNESDFYPVASWAIDAYLSLLGQWTAAHGTQGFVIFLSYEINASAFGIIQLIFPDSRIPLEGLLGIGDVVIPTDLTIEGSL